MANKSLSQDTIITISKEKIGSRVFEVNLVEIKYKKSDNPNGPIFVLPVAKVLAIKYEDGKTDTLYRDLSSSEDLLQLSRTNPDALLSKGNNVFVEFPDKEAKYCEKDFMAGLREWGYWNVVTNEGDAHFTIEFVALRKMGTNVRAYCLMKTVEKKEFKRSEEYVTFGNAFNNFEVHKLSAKKVNDWLKQNFK